MASVFRARALSGCWLVARRPLGRAWARVASTRGPQQTDLPLGADGAAPHANRNPAPPPPLPPLPPPAAGTYTDIRAGTWLERALPRAAGPYLRLARIDRPVGTWLLLWPCVWSTTLAAPPGTLPDARLLGLFAVGALAMRGAGCTINDMWDRDIDRQVERTRGRPLASGELSLAQATVFLGAQLLTGLGVLVQLPPVAIGISLASVPLVVAYPLAKRVTSWPQLVLGLTFNWGALVGWVAVRGDVPLEVLAPLYMGAVCWTLHYDTLYAYQDARDDKRAGVRSSALSLGAEAAGGGGRARSALALFALGATAGVAGAGHAVGLAEPFYAGLALGGAGLLWQAATVPLIDRAACLAAFQQSQRFGLVVAVAIAAGRLAQVA
ncbi:hypothetical protein KFE25_009299 [Diacronema lutheri]|uniref:4-hydroxybenzoate polyprenyltransferase, mitochondrial n=1 Tax=Diacronema lutheri TaxID=2081491 RepID=A0A8J5XSH3_DIALT|nr:hypothetical protein KFE25_009299 [Diacronema lutheri]